MVRKNNEKITTLTKSNDIHDDEIKKAERIMNKLDKLLSVDDDEESEGDS